ncbi:MAG TPA: ATP-grasp domain-containing protein [Rhodanobacteraceae bacterium]|jgi:protein-tyrosine-phosphatase/predicted ATP-grasp superfamily ATP-dependent carboligase
MTSPDQAKVLILDGHARAAAESVLSLPKSCVLHVAAVEHDALAFASPRVACALAQPANVAALREWLLALDRRERYDLILCSTEASLLALKSDRLDPRVRAKAVLPGEPSLDIALNKQRTTELARSLGIKTPSETLVTADSEKSAPEPAYPVVVKPLRSKIALADGVKSLDPRICADAGERKAALAAILPLTPVVEQEYFRGRGIGIEMLFERGRPRWCFAHERLHELPVTGGASSYRCAIEPPPELLGAATKLLAHLHWHGVAMVEFKLAEDGDYRLLEINPRLWGSLPLATAAGVNFPLGLLKIALGQPLEPQPHYRRGMRARNLGADARWFVQAWRQRRSPLLVSPLRVRDFIALLRPLAGGERWDLFRWREPRLCWKALREAMPRAQGAGPARDARANWRKLRASWRNRRIRRVLVLCYGNICRSPVVAALLQSCAKDVEIVSAGFHAQARRRMPDDWANVVEQTTGMRLDDHRSRVVDAALIEWADLIIVMDTANWRMLARTHRHAITKAVLLGVAATGRGARAEIADPYTLDESGMRPIATTLQRCVDDLVKQRSANV